MINKLFALAVSIVIGLTATTAIASDKRIARYLTMVQTIVWLDGSVTHVKDLVKPYSFRNNPVQQCYNDMMYHIRREQRRLKGLDDVEITDEWIPEVYGDYAYIQAKSKAGVIVKTTYECDFMSWNEVPYDLR